MYGVDCKRLMLKRLFAVVVFVATLFALSVASGYAETAEKQAFLGVYLGDKVKILIKEGNKTEELCGALIEALVDDGPAEKAGLDQGDIIVKFNGKEVQNSKELRAEIRLTKPGDKVDVVVHRNGKTENYQVTMGENDDVPFSFNLLNIDSPMKIGKYVTIGGNDTPWLGIEMQDLGKQLREYFKISGEQGVLISEVVEGSPAEKAVLKAGDILLKIGIKNIESAYNVHEALGEYEAGDEVALKLQRDGKSFETKAILTENPNKLDLGLGCCDDGKIIRVYGDKFKDAHLLFEEELELKELQRSLDDIKGDIEVDVESLKKDIQEMRIDLEEIHEEMKKK